MMYGVRNTKNSLWVLRAVHGFVEWSRGACMVFTDIADCNAYLDAATRYCRSLDGSSVLAEVVPLLAPEEVEAREKAAFDAGWEYKEDQVEYDSASPLERYGVLRKSQDEYYAAWKECQK